MTTLRAALDRIEFVRLGLHLQLQQPARIPAWFELGLRPRLQQAGSACLPAERCALLLEPPLPADPAAVRRHQRPAPAFALQPLARPVTPASELALALILFGDGLLLLDDLLPVLAHVAQGGLWPGAPAAQLTRVVAYLADSTPVDLPLPTAGPALPVAPRITARWWLENFDHPGPWQLTITTPMRLVSHGKPLFAPTLRHILPFALRRVTAMLHTWCHLDLTQPEALLADPLLTTADERQLTWVDWRQTHEFAAPQGGGGVTGCLPCPPLSQELLLLLQLGSLLNLGKGATYGAGCYRLLPQGEERW